MSELTPEDEAEIRRLHRSGKWTQIALAIRYNVSTSAVNSIVNA